MAEINAAIDENILDCFVLESHKTVDGPFISSVFYGQIKRKTTEKIFVKMSDESFAEFQKICMEQSFDIRLEI